MKREILTFLLYKDYSKEIEELIEYGDDFYSKINHVPSPFITHDYNDFIQFLWTFLVINYGGDYGTCVIYGWIDDWKKASEFLKEILSNYE